MSEWVLVPVKKTGVDVWDAMLAARPPIPRAVWDEMVENMRRVLCADYGEHPDLYDEDWHEIANRCLLAALGHPEIAHD